MRLLAGQGGLDIYTLGLGVGLGVGVGLGLGVGLEQFFKRRSGDRTRVDGVCDFEKAPPDQLYPSTKRD